MNKFNGIQKEYKDRLFKFIFGHPEHLDWTLSLYNAINGTSYTNTADIKITTINDAVYMSMKNDVYFLVDNIMSLYEQQSTFNPNMPMRFLIYAGMIYSKFIEQSEDYNPYSYSQQKAPTPRCVCFYNGISKKPDRTILKLSDAFAPDSNPDIEVTVTMININYGHNSDLMNACQPLKEYSWFIDRIQTLRKEFDTVEEAIDLALSELSDDFLIKPFIVANKSEVRNMCITEYNEEQTIKKMKKEYVAEGIEIGREEGIEIGKEEGIEIGKEEGLQLGALNALAGLVRKGIVTILQAAEQANMTVSEFEAKTGLKA